MMDKMHTKEDIIAHLKDDLKDELEDILKYGEMHKALTSLGMLGEAHYIEEIARDEYTHACAIKKILEAHDVDVKHSEMSQLWDKAYEAFDD